VQCCARADGKALEEVVHELGLEVAYAHDLHLQVDNGGGRPLRSMAATASVSSIGITK
jgi:hypothetical protein